MKTTIALIIKFIVMLAAAWVSFMIFGTAAFWTVLIIAAAGTVLNYLIGDLLFLPRFGNIVSLILDGILAGVLAWIVMRYTPVTYYYMTSVYVFALIVAVAEFFFHMYLIGANVIEKKKSDSDLLRKNKLNYNAETGSELHPYSDRDSFSDSRSSGYGNNSGDNGFNSSRSSNSNSVNSGYNKSTNQSGSNVTNNSGSGGKHNSGK